MKRSEFIQKTLFSVLALVGFGQMTSCSSDSTDNNDNGGNNGGNNGGGDNGGSNKTLSVVIGGNHGHGHTLSSEDVEGETGGTYHLNGPHSHSFSLTKTDMQNLKSGSTVNVTATDGHTHGLTITYK